MSAFEDGFLSGPMAAHPHQRRGGGAVQTRLIRLDSPSHAVIDPPTSDLVIGLILKGGGAARWAWDGAAPNVTDRRRPGTLGLTPIEARGTFEIEGASSILIVALPYPALAERLEPDLPVPRDFGRLHDVYSDQPLARALCLKLWRAAGRAGFDDDGLVDLLSERLLAHLASPGKREAMPVSGLGRLERARVERAADRPSADVAALARAASMPVRTFRRRFQATFQVPPHRWLADRRIASAKVMLAASGGPLSQIALDLGFANQAHFTLAFGRAVGVSPGRYRREITT